ncbi:MAG TPA: hypothetical protein VK879_02305 [Candidatus Sulfomarinibacteraceae bacterium]|nr:hypothetical protein [Candidatus Sulfomarinibacteraceae bacterium]
MKTIFGLFDTFGGAKEGIEALLEEALDEEQMNVIVREDVAKENLDVNLQAVDVKKTAEVGEQTVRGLAHLLGGQQAVHVPDIGDVLAAGDLATILAKRASSLMAPDQALAAALQEFSVPEDVAGAYQTGVNEGGLLFWIRVEDGQAAAAANALRTAGATQVSDYSS